MKPLNLMEEGLALQKASSQKQCDLCPYLIFGNGWMDTGLCYECAKNQYDDKDYVESEETA